MIHIYAMYMPLALRSLCVGLKRTCTYPVKGAHVAVNITTSETNRQYMYQGCILFGALSCLNMSC